MPENKTGEVIDIILKNTIPSITAIVGFVYLVLKRIEIKSNQHKSYIIDVCKEVSKEVCKEVLTELINNKVITRLEANEKDTALLKEDVKIIKENILKNK